MRSLQWLGWQKRPEARSHQRPQFQPKLSRQMLALHLGSCKTINKKAQQYCLLLDMLICTMKDNNNQELLANFSGCNCTTSSFVYNAMVSLLYAAASDAVSQLRMIKQDCCNLPHHVPRASARPVCKNHHHGQDIAAIPFITNTNALRHCRACYHDAHTFFWMRKLDFTSLQDSPKFYLTEGEGQAMMPR